MSAPGAPFGVQAVTVDYAGRRALDAVTMAVPAGQISAVVGGDGAGKTTLLGVLAGRIVPSSGSVQRPVQRLIGLQSATSGVWLDLTVQENVAFIAATYHLDRASSATRAQALLASAGLDGTTRRLARHLSGGMRQKLGFVLAMLHRPALLLLDEPTTGVDPVSRVELWQLIAGAAADGAAVLMATTYLDEAERAQDVLVLDAGRPLAAGSPETILAHTPGAIVASSHLAARPTGEKSWRRGNDVHTWYPPGSAPVGEMIAPDMEDSVIAYTLNQREARHG